MELDPDKIPDPSQDTDPLRQAALVLAQVAQRYDTDYRRMTFRADEIAGLGKGEIIEIEVRRVRTVAWQQASNTSYAPEVVVVS